MLCYHDQVMAETRVETAHEISNDRAGKLRDRGVTIRAILIGLVLIAINNYWITVIEVRWYALDGTCLPIFVTPIFILFVLALTNMGVRLVVPSISLRRGEMIVIYSMMVMGAAFAGHDLIQNLFGTIGHAYHGANDANRYHDLFFRYLPESWFLNDKTAAGKFALNGFYQGNVYPWTWAIMKVWVTPLALWGTFMIALVGVMMCMNVLIRKQWTEHEKLVFPLIQLPLEMTAPDSGHRLYASRLMWGGFAIAFSIGLINGLAMLYPSLPMLQGVKAYDLAPSLGNGPMQAMARGGNGLKMASYPFAIGLAYFIPLDLSFSCWFFYIARKLMQVAGEAFGLGGVGNNDFPYYDSQSSGAWLALGVIIVIGALPYLKAVWRQAWNERGSDADRAESRLYRRAIIGIVIGCAVLMALAMSMGMAGWAAALFFGIYFLIAITITRVRAELGTPHEIYFVNPQQIMVSLLGFNLIGPMNLTGIYSMYWFNRCVRSHPMPNQLESLKMAEGTAIKIVPLVLTLMLASVGGLLASYYSNLSVTYAGGAGAKCAVGFKAWVGRESFDRLSTALRDRPAVDTLRISYMAVGAAMVIALKMLRGSFAGWPFHPAGYALAVSYAMDYFWFAFIISWLAKLLIVRYGGMKLHNKAVPFFLGLILGDFCIGSIWAIVGPLIGQQTYKIFI
jgi:hypothetical protein